MTILCYGDSNTYGYIPETGMRYPQNVRYPGRLQLLLGEKADVIEEGCNGRTTIQDDPVDGWKNGLDYLRPCLHSHRPVDIVILMLGSNDLKEAFRLTAEQIAANAGILVDVIKEFTLEKQGFVPKILLVSPPEIGENISNSPFYGAFTERAIRESQKFPEFYRAVAEEKDCLFFDAAAYIRPSEFDSLHLTPEGHQVLAEKLYDEVLRMTSKKRYSYVLFDLDGTLTDSGPGIMNGFTYATGKMGDRVTDADVLRRFVGPPLKDSFSRVLGYTPEETEKAIALYREYYNTMGGVLENEVYPGIPGLLSDLRRAGMTLAVATSKSAQATNTVLTHFGLREYFDFVATADDESRPQKTDVIRYVLDHYKITDKSRVVMIGDRENDVTAAKNVGIDSIGVLYGYGDKEELAAAGATYIVECVADIKEMIM